MKASRRDAADLKLCAETPDLRVCSLNRAETVVHTAEVAEIELYRALMNLNYLYNSPPKTIKMDQPRLPHNTRFILPCPHGPRIHG
jgi:hypothetical protein